VLVLVDFTSSVVRTVKTTGGNTDVLTTEMVKTMGTNTEVLTTGLVKTPGINTEVLVLVLVDFTSSVVRTSV
jgi:hypothetical protein